MSIVGLDLSLTSSGIAIWEPDSIQTYARGFTGHKGDSPLTRNPKISKLSQEVVALVPDGSFVVIEGPSYKSVSTSSWDRAGLWHAVVAGCAKKGCSVSCTPPLNAKMWLTGHPGASKSLMIACVRDLTGHIPGTDDEADALTFALMGAHHLGLVAEEEPYRVKALSGVEWAPAPHTMLV